MYGAVYEKCSAEHFSYTAHEIRVELRPIWMVSYLQMKSRMVGIIYM